LQGQGESVGGGGEMGEGWGRMTVRVDGVTVTCEPGEMRGITGCAR
jgi:hypothetical protein